MLYYIISTERSEWQLPSFWKPGKWGYTIELSEAGKFTREEAYDIFRMSGFQDIPVPVEELTTTERAS